MDYGTSLQTIHSDTLHAAIISSLVKIGREIPPGGDFGFTISSLFPYFQKNNNPVYFLPKLKSQSIPSKVLQDSAKKIKKIEWLDIGFFNSHIKGAELFSEDFDTSLLKNGVYLTTQEIDKDFLTKEVTPRVAVPRDYNIQKDAEPFYMERIYFKYESGLYFFAEGNTGVIEDALNILKDEGIGTDRTVGNGFFEWETDTIELSLPESRYITSLSLFLPENDKQISDMLNDAYAAYDLMKRGGWLTDAGFNTLRKNFVYMFTEGSVFVNDISINTQKTLGKIVDLKPEVEHKNIGHPVYRSGKAFFIPVKL
jgi:CRISPR-associated protein Csm4